MRSELPEHELRRPGAGAAEPGSVAVIMRTRDRPALLPRALASVLSQVHANWRLYLVNDGGDGQVVETVLDPYRPAFGNRLTVIHHPESKGMENASNAGLERAVEQYAVIHDDDDSWHPEFLSATVEFMDMPENRAIVAVTTRCMLVRECISGDRFEVQGREPWPYVNTIIDFQRMLSLNSIPPICLLFRRDVIDRIGPFNGDLPVLGDWDFNLRLMTLGDIEHIERPLANYHHREAGSGVYGNTVVDKSDLHDRHQIMIRNRMLRETLAVNPGLMGLLHVLARSGESLATFDEGRLARVEARLENIERTLGSCAAGINTVRKRTRPLSKVIRDYFKRNKAGILAWPFSNRSNG